MFNLLTTVPADFKMSWKYCNTGQEYQDSSSINAHQASSPVLGALFTKMVEL